MEELCFRFYSFIEVLPSSIISIIKVLHIKEQRLKRFVFYFFL